MATPGVFVPNLLEGKVAFVTGTDRDICESRSVDSALRRRQRHLHGDDSGHDAVRGQCVHCGKNRSETRDG